MRQRLLLLLLVTAVGCQPPIALGENGAPIFRQGAISDIACGPSALFNWMSHGGSELEGILGTLSANRTPAQTVQHMIDTYGKRPSATNPSVVRYGRHNGGVGSVNLMLMAQELLGDHLDAPPTLRGEYLHRADGESADEHQSRVTQTFSESIEAGVPVLLYLRRYQRTADRRRPRVVFGHHVVVTSVDAAKPDSQGEGRRSSFTFVDSSTGRSDRGVIAVAEQEFTAPTFAYQLEDGRASTVETLRTGHPLLETRVPSYESGQSAKREIMVAHFATFAVHER